MRKTEALESSHSGWRRHDLGAPAPALPAADADLLPPRATASGTLRRMLLSALVLFGERGYHAVPVREIARGAGVRASSMYEHRGSKEELLIDLMTIGHEEHHAWLTEALRGAGDRPDQQVAALVRAHVLLHATYPLLARVCNRELSALPAERLARVLTIRSASVSLLIDVIERGIRRRVFAVPDSYLAAAALGAMGIRVAEWYVPDGGISVDDVADTYATFALRMLGFPEIQ